MTTSNHTTAGTPLCRPAGNEKRRSLSAPLPNPFPATFSSRR